MRKLQRLLGVVVVLIMLLGSVGGVAIAEQGTQTGTSTQGGGRVGPTRPTPTPPVTNPEPEPQQPPQQPPSNEGGGGTTAPPRSSSGVSAQTGAQGPSRPAPEPVDPPSTGGGSGAVWVLVDLSEQRIWVYRGDTLLDSTLVRTGKAGFETPTGTFYINSKYRYDDMSGREGGESWDVRNVPYVMYFTGRGHALHGAPWANSFGFPASHGCVNLPVSFAGWLYSIAPIGTKVVIRW